MSYQAQSYKFHSSLLFYNYSFLNLKVFIALTVKHSTISIIPFILSPTLCGTNYNTCELIKLISHLNRPAQSSSQTFSFAHLLCRYCMCIHPCLTLLCGQNGKAKPNGFQLCKLFSESTLTVQVVLFLCCTYFCCLSSVVHLTFLSCCISYGARCDNLLSNKFSGLN
jgi:hypothetical protein